MKRQQWHSGPDEGERQQARNYQPGRGGMAGENEYGRRDDGRRRGGGSEEYDQHEPFATSHQPQQGGDEYGGGEYGRGDLGSQRGGRRSMEPGGRPRYRDENEPPYGGADFESDPFVQEHGFGGQSGRYGGVPDFDESPYEQGGTQRRGFGRGGQMGSQQRWEQGHWGADQGDFRSTPSSSGSQGYGQSSGGRQWGDMERGRQGPRGYARSDERIREFICERLAQHQQLEVSDVSVEVKDGCVVLEGTVPERRMKHQIEDTADNCWGVKDVVNRIRVQSQSGNGSPQGSQLGQGRQGSQSGQSSQNEHGSEESEQGFQGGRATAADPKATGSSGRGQGKT